VTKHDSWEVQRREKANIRQGRIEKEGDGQHHVGESTDLKAVGLCCGTPTAVQGGLGGGGERPKKGEKGGEGATKD